MNNNKKVHKSILEKFGYTITESRVLPYSTFSQILSREHDFVYVCGSKND